MCCVSLPPTLSSPLCKDSVPLRHLTHPCSQTNVVTCYLAHMLPCSSATSLICHLAHTHTHTHTHTHNLAHTSLLLRASVALQRVHARPLSPDVLEIDNKGMHYKFPWGALSSIANRATGVALSVGGCAHE